MYDFIIFFEHQARELENAVLLSEYLNKQGYSTCVLRINSFKMLYKKAKVVIVPYCYNNDDLFTFISFPFYNPTKIINLQYEQIYTAKDEESGKIYPTENAKKCQIVTWGEHTYNNLLRSGIDSSCLHKIGNFALDFNSEKFNDYFKTKNNIAEEFGLPLDKKWHLFISSFSLNNLEEEHVKELQRLIDDIDERIEYSKKSQIQILEWFKRFLKDNEDTCIIYRPHPAEKVVGFVKDLEKEFKNFYIINDYSIRQWIRISDSISNWYSTSLVDIYFAHKTCFILRPLSISLDEDVIIMKEASFVESYDDFESLLNNQKGVLFPIDTNILKSFFYNTFEGTCYIKLGNFCIDVLKNDKIEYDFKKSLGFSRFYYLKMYIWLILMFFAEHFDITNIFPKKYRTQLSYMYKEGCGYEKNIKQIRDRLEKVLNER